VRPRELPIRLDGGLFKAQGPLRRATTHFTHALYIRYKATANRQDAPFARAAKTAKQAASSAAEVARWVGRDDIALNFVAHVRALTEPQSWIPLVGDLEAAWPQVEGALRDVAIFTRGFEGERPDDALLTDYAPTWPTMVNEILAAPVGPQRRPEEGAEQAFATELREFARRVREPRFRYTGFSWRLYTFEEFYGNDTFWAWDRKYQHWRWHEVPVTDAELKAARYDILAEALIQAGTAPGTTQGRIRTVMPSLRKPRGALRPIADFAERLAGVIESRQP
jgi:hypothetical protein